MLWIGPRSQRLDATAHRLDEQERGQPEGFPRLGAYTRRWWAWSRAGLTAPHL